ncbi:Asp-tRNA(Asn)/Glu-tRNA(Gln) amidotransferase subunit GatB [Candidatus Daviesbacteria bacterium]|nr:Asp-tRNA(Asn)/Glu-tRNA(Gln) amidotransferase subunit GatB [Candidatus Daviesbacteria bacterium]
MSIYKPVIGLEVHVELNTKSKMFCSCSADYFGKAPNTHTCPVCLGLPGALPYANKEAIRKCIQIGLALNCTISEDSLFERKNYFYPDLAKGFQISQLRWPLCVGGEIEVESDFGEKSLIRINRVHQEEDTGKLSHLGGVTLIDFNRSGVPLVEIVTEPDFTDSSQIRDYAKKLQQIFRYLGVSNADMEKGDMRLEANVSVREVKSEEGRGTDFELPNYRVELKNINSFRFIVAAVEFEIKRQINALEAGEKLHQETRGWDEDKKETYLQRSKEEANDYRYFPEPDLPGIKNQELRIKEIQDGLPELPSARIKKYIDQYGISKTTAETLVADESLAELFDGAVKLGLEENVPVKEVANYLVNSPTLASHLKGGKLNISPDEIVQAVKEKKSGKIEDEGELEKIAQEVISENEKSVNDYKSGKESAIMALVGGVMRKTSGKANAIRVKQILERLLL